MLPGQRYTPEDVLRIVWRHRWLILVPLVLATVGAAVYSLRLPNRYRSETVILVVPQRVPESYVRSTVTSRIEDRLTTIQSQILSRSNLEGIIRTLDLYPEQRKTLVIEDVVALMRLDIEGPRIERGDAFRVGYVSIDARLAQQVTDRLASLFIAANLRERELQADGTTQFLEAQLEDARQRLVEHEKKLESFRRQHNGELPSQTEANLRAIEAAQTRIQAIEEASYRDRELRLSLERQIADLEARLPVLLSAPSAAGVIDPGATMAEQLEMAKAQLAALAVKLKSGHPDLESAARRVRDLQARYEQENRSKPADAPPAAPAEVLRENRLRDLRDQLANLQNRQKRQQIDVERLEADIATYQARVNVAPTRESDLIALTRDYATMQTTYTGLRGKLEESKLSADLERRQVGEQFRILDPPEVPERPFGPNRVRLIGLAALVGLALGLGLVALIEYFNKSVRTDADVVRVLQLPVLARVPLVLSERERRATRRYQILAGVAVLVVVAASAGAYAAWKLQVF